MNCKTTFSRAATLTSSLFAMLAIVPFLYGQAVPPPQPQQQQQQKDQGKDAQKDAKAPGQNAPGQNAPGQAKDQGKDQAKDQAKDKGRDGERDLKGQQQQQGQNQSQQGAQQQNQGAQQQNQPRPGQTQPTQPGQTRDQGRDQRSQGQDQGRDQRTQGQNDQSRDQRMQGQYDQGRDQRTQGQNDQRSRDTGRQTRDESGAAASGRSTFRSSDVRAPDIGLWFDRSDRNGLVISDISSKGAISRLGFHEGDRIVSVNGYRVNRETDFLNYLFANDVREQRVKVIVERDGREEVVWVEPTMLVEDYQYVDNDPLENFGVVLDDRYDDRIVIWKVIPQSPAYYAGLRAGDVFTTFHGRPVTTRQDFVRIIGDLREGEVPVQVRRGERVRDFAVDVPRFEARSERRTAMRPNYDTTRAAQRQENRQERRQDRAQGGPVPAPSLQPRPGR